MRSGRSIAGAGEPRGEAMKEEITLYNIVIIRMMKLSLLRQW